MSPQESETSLYHDIRSRRKYEIKHVAKSVIRLAEPSAAEWSREVCMIKQGSKYRRPLHNLFCLSRDSPNLSWEGEERRKERKGKKKEEEMSWKSLLFCELYDQVCVCGWGCSPISPSRPCCLKCCDWHFITSFTGALKINFTSSPPDLIQVFSDPKSSLTVVFRHTAVIFLGGC